MRAEFQTNKEVANGELLSSLSFLQAKRIRNPSEGTERFWTLQKDGGQASQNDSLICRNLLRSVLKKGAIGRPFFPKRSLSKVFS